MDRPRGYTGALVALAFSGPMRRMSWRLRLAVVVFAFPLLMLLAAALYTAESALYVLRSEPVTGTVVQRYEWVGETIFDRGKVNYEPIFTYEMEGETRRASVGSAHGSFDLEVGDTATIRAIPSSRGNVRLDTWQGLWFMPVVLGLMGGAALLVAGLFWLVVTRIFFRKDAR
ncbi:MAG: hypothetical protein RIG84_05495 [Roseovarius sp.]